MSRMHQATGPMRGPCPWSLIIAMAIVLAGEAQAQSGSNQADSLKSYELSEIVVGGAGPVQEPVRRIHRLALADLVRMDVPDVAGVLRLVPATHLQTNSRGETLAYIRGHGERQIAIFLDGAPLNIPWDNRVDLSMLPSNVLGGVSVHRGAVGPAWGANVSGGVLNLQTRSLEREGHLTEFGTRAGTQQSLQLSGMHARNRGRYSALAAASLEDSNGQPVPSEAELPYSQSGELRTNTDRRGNSLFARVGFDAGIKAWGLSILHADASKGVAPESHLNPQVERVRFWRYPEWRNTMAILNARTTTEQYDVSGTLWTGLFRQRIEQFATDDYDERTDTQDDEDLSFGGRLIVGRRMDHTRLRWAGNILASRHAQQDRTFGPAGPDLVLDESYRYLLYSMGIEAETSFDDLTSGLVGITVDGQSYPRTGDKPSQNGMQAWTANAALTRTIATDTEFRVSGGRKVRFPTMRELFGAALGTFLVNPGLKPESNWTAEASLSRKGETASGEVNAFWYRTRDAIDQENVMVDGERFRRRINLEGSRVYGLEVLGTTRPASWLDVSGHVTWMRPIGFQDGDTVHLVEKPELLSTLTAAIHAVGGITFSTTGILTGVAYGRNVDNDLVQLPASFLVNIRVAARRYHQASGLFIEGYAGVDNVTDDLSLPQPGLPGPGRTARVGISLSY